MTTSFESSDVATSADAPDVLVDTSVAIPFMIADHPAHQVVVDELGRRVLGLSGHAAFEAFSVLTRLPGSNRLNVSDAIRALVANFPATRHLGADAATQLHRSLGTLGIAGGAVYDALVAAAAQEHRAALATRDRNALDTYRANGVQIEVIG